MSALDILLVLVILTALVMAVRYIVRHKGAGCSGNCAGCQCRCDSRKE